MKTLNNLKAGFLLFRRAYKIYKEASLTAKVQYGYGNCFHILFKGWRCVTAYYVFVDESESPVDFPP